MLVNLMERILDLDRLLDKSTLLQKPPYIDNVYDLCQHDVYPVAHMAQGQNSLDNRQTCLHIKYSRCQSRLMNDNGQLLSV